MCVCLFDCYDSVCIIFNYLNTLDFLNLRLVNKTCWLVSCEECYLIQFHKHASIIQRNFRLYLNKEDFIYGIADNNRTISNLTEYINDELPLVYIRYRYKNGKLSRLFEDIYRMYLTFIKFNTRELSEYDITPHLVLDFFEVYNTHIIN